MRNLQSSYWIAILMSVIVSILDIVYGPNTMMVYLSFAFLGSALLASFADAFLQDYFKGLKEISNGRF